MPDTTLLTELNEFFPPALAEKPRWVAARYKGETQKQADARVAKAKARQAKPDSTGKFYLWENVPSSNRRYWDGKGWTTDPKAAKFFDTAAEADLERNLRASGHSNVEIIIDRATKNVFA